MFAASKTASPSGGGPDEKFNYVTMLLHGDGTNGSANKTFIDSSSNNYAITQAASTVQGTFTPYGSNWSNYFDDATATRLTLASNTAFAFGTGAYTVEAWINLSTYAANQSTIFDAGAATNAWDLSVLFTGAVSIGKYGVGAILNSSSSAVTLNTWVHVAAVRASTATNNTKIYVNGVLVGTGTDANNWTVTTTPSIAGYNLAGYSLNGYISNLRVVKGTAVYTAAFTPSTTPLTAITNTSLLTCADNRFIDDSTNAFAITANGTPSVQRFNPFGTSTAYSTSVIGGSTFFPAIGRLTTAVRVIPTGSFTVECWVYMTNTDSMRYFVAQGTITGTNRFLMGVRYGSWFVGIQGSTINTGTPVNNQWNHVAATYDGSTLRLYVNGVLLDSIAASGSVQDSNLTIGQDYYSSGATEGITGYVSNLRISNTVRSISVPTAPYTSDANTSFLLSATNAGVVDNAMTQDLITNGGSQVSTAVVKYGTASLYFSGGSSSFLVAANNPAFSFGTGDFTIEFWAYRQSGGNGFRAVVGNYSTFVSGAFFFGGDSATGQGINFGSKTTGDHIYTSGNPFPFDTWTHLAAVRSGTTITIYSNGTSVGSFTDATSYSLTAGLTIGSAQQNNNNIYNGYIDDLRITRGYARYTADFTPPTAALPDKGPY